MKHIGAKILTLLCLALLFTLLPGAGAYADGVSYLYYESEEAAIAQSPLTGTAANCTPVTASAAAVTWNSGWYAVNSDVTISERITVSGDVHLILCDGATLTAQKGITVETVNNLTIYAQSTGDSMGTLTANGTGFDAGIGGTGSSSSSVVSCGTITIHGGNVTATGGPSESTYNICGAGIGGGGCRRSAGGAGGTVTVYGGSVHAAGGGTNPYAAGGAGIGGGGAGSGGGAGGTVTICGGTVNANGGTNGAGIGGGGTRSRYGGTAGTVTIKGGTVNATGGISGAGIGGGIVRAGGEFTISGGAVTATGGAGAAGIGGGEMGAGGEVTITGGAVKATGGEYGAGIGGGSEGAGGKFTISGGAVTATGGEGAAGIGGAYSSNAGTVSLGNGFMVWAGGSESPQGNNSNIVHNFETTHSQQYVYAEMHAPIITGADLVLNGSLDLRFYVALPKGFNGSGAYMSFTIPGRNPETGTTGRSVNVNFDDAVNAADGQKIFPCPVYSIEMAKTINAAFRYGESSSVEKDYSVQEYLNTFKDGDGAYALAAAAKNYGHYMQPYLAGVHKFTLGANTYPEIEAGPTSLTPADMEELANYKRIWGTGGFDSDALKSMGFFDTFAASTALNIRLVFNDAPDNVTATVNDGAVSANVKSLNATTYQIEIPNIAANNLGTAYHVVVTADGAVVYDVNMSALSYVYAVLNAGRSQAGEADALTAFYDYYTAARQYGQSN